MSTNARVEMFERRRAEDQAARPGIVPRAKKHVLVLTDGFIGDRMSGTGIRYFELARHLSSQFEVSLGHPHAARELRDNMKVIEWCVDEPEQTLSLAREADFVLVHAFVLEKLPRLRDVAKRLIVDLYCPYVFENMEIHRDRGVDLELRQTIHGNDLRVLCEQLIHGDYFLCCTERQRDWIVGMLTALGRLHPASCRQIASPMDLVGLVPFGLPTEIPTPSGDNVMKGVWPGVERDDLVVLWGGGLWSWLDPLTIVRAMALVSAVRSDVKLVFLSSKTAETVIDMPMAGKVLELAEALGLRGKSVIFNDRSYIEYDRRTDYFLEADIGVCAHQETMETYYAYRTRLLDYLNAATPILTSQGDYFGDYVARNGLGKALPIGNPEAWANAILELAASPDARAECRRRIMEKRDDFTWSRAVAPLVEFCLKPPTANDAGECWRHLRRLSEVKRTRHNGKEEADSETRMAFVEALSRIKALRSQYDLLSDAHSQLLVQHAYLTDGVEHLQAKVNLVKRIPFAETLWRILGKRFRKR
ncbi:MAG TPA: glycosyltransferase family 4 protein [Vicinamibacteria bacterium]|nr:glycosyltransferase family 4 protein [Vicinamibacteria bacterium]